MSAYRTLKTRVTTGMNRAIPDLKRIWQQVNDYFPSLAITKITYDPNNTNVFYFCTGEGWFNADAVRGAGDIQIDRWRRDLVSIAIHRFCHLSSTVRILTCIPLPAISM